MKVQKLAIVFLASVFSLPTNVGAEEIVFDLVRTAPSQYQKDVCVLHFKVTNDSFGSLYRFNARYNVYDDRDSKKGSGDLSIPGSGVGPSRIPIGSDVEARATAKGKCEYLRKIIFLSARENCNIRKMPENETCFGQMAVRSSLKEVNAIKE